MSIALMGCHRSGKSTLARAYAEKTGVPYVPSRAGEVFQRFGFAVGEPLTAAQRLDVQDAILDQHIADISQAGWQFVADRSSFDMAAYVLAELGYVDEETSTRALAYVDRCITVANQRYGMLLLVQPGIPYVAEGGKPPPSRLAQERLNTVLWGITSDTRVKARCCFLLRENLKLEDRLAAMIALHGMMVKAQVKEVKLAQLYAC